MIDLHVHSRHSDGTDSPTDLVTAAHHAAGLVALALTDHDSLDGVGEASAVAGGALEVVAGCEFSSAIEGRGIHLLCYFVPPSGALDALLGPRRAARAQRNERLVDHLATSGLPITFAEVEAVADGAVIGRPHVAAVLVANGVVADSVEAFSRYLSDRALGSLGLSGTPAHEVLDAARVDHAPVALAHPLDLGAALESLVSRLVAAGLSGLEAEYGSYSSAERRVLTACARGFGLVATGGSDYHGARTPNCELGRAYGDLEVADSVLEELRERR